MHLSTDMAETAQSNADTAVIETLLAMKETRGCKYYQVCCTSVLLYNPSLLSFHSGPLAW